MVTRTFVIAIVVLGLSAGGMSGICGIEAQESSSPASPGTLREDTPPAVAISDAQPQRRRLLVFFGAAPTLSPVDTRLVYESFIDALRRSDGNLTLLEHTTLSIPQLWEERYAEARRRGAHGWLTVTVDGNMDDLRISADSFDILRNSGVENIIAPPDRPVPFRFIRQAYWIPLTEPRTTRQRWNTPLFTTVALIVHAPEGTVLSGITPEPVTVGPEGWIEIPVPPPATVTLRGELPGHTAAVQTVYIRYDPVTIVLEPTSYAHWAAEFRANGLQFPAVRATWYPLPGVVYLKAGGMTYLMGLYLLDEDTSDSAPDLIASNPLSLLTIHGGGYFTAPERPVRLYGDVGAFLRLNHSGGAMSVDSVAPWGLSAALGVEYAPLGKIRFFLEYEPLIYLPPSVDDFLKVSFPPDYYSGRSVPGHIVTDDAVIDMRNIVLGIRYSFR